jgi:ribonucleotide monophosphatase NagD (HAD superfamily)
VGDDAVADVIGGITAGLQGILVRTGKYRSGDERKVMTQGGQVVNDIDEAVDCIL